MADEPIETVAVRLLADARPLLEMTDEAVETVTESMDEMGQAIEETLSEKLQEGGQAISDFAEKFRLSIEQAMGVMKKTGDLDKFLGSFSESDLLKAAEVITGQIVEPLIEAKTAADGFGEAINVQVADLLTLLEQSDAIDEFLSAFSLDELDVIASNIDQSITDPLEVAARTFVELSNISGITIGEIASQFDLLEVEEVFGGQDNIDAIVTMGSAIQRDLQIPIENAEKAIIEFARSVGLSVQDVVEAFGGEGQLDKFLSNFSSEELEKMADNINNGLVKPVIDATTGAIELSAQAEGVGSAVEGWVDPLEDAGSALEQTVVPAGEKIESGIIQPMEEASEVTEEFSDTVDTTIGSKVPGDLEQATDAAEQFGNVYSDALEEAGFQTSLAVEELKKFVDESDKGLLRICTFLLRKRREVYRIWHPQE